MRLRTVERIPERKILHGDTCFVQRKDTESLTDKEKRTIRDLEWSGVSHAVIENEIGKSYKRTDAGDYVAVPKGGGALILEWTLGKRTYSCRFKNKRCARDAVRDIAKLEYAYLLGDESKELQLEDVGAVEAIRQKAKALANRKQAAQAAREAWKPTPAQKAYEAWSNAEGHAELDDKKRLANFYAKHSQYRSKPPTRKQQGEQARKQREHAAKVKAALDCLSVASR